MIMLLDVKKLVTYFFTEAGIVKAVDGVDFKVGENKVVGLVGESGSGKTVTAYSVLRTVPRPGRIISGEVIFKSENLVTKKEEEMRKIRGGEISMIFQDPTSSLNPLYTVGDQLTEVIRAHQEISKNEAVEKAIKLIEMTGIPEAETRISSYPHELSGGMKQRIAIARAISSEPSLLFADEPTTNLDVTIQAQVLDLLKDLKDKSEMSMVMITHDMGIIAEMTEKVTVLYAGKVAEVADTDTLFEKPTHPYTEALLTAVPTIERKRELKVIPGNIPNLIEPPSGCRFHPRCLYAKEVCSEKIPETEEVEQGHLTACHRWKELSLTGIGG
jgi:oligopeptide/dipeptide ABC transporter ATP-binding protein